MKQADEIRFIEQDLDRIMDYLEELKDKTIIYTVSDNFTFTAKNTNTLMLYNESFNKFMIAVEDIHLIEKFTELNLSCYWSYPIHTYYDLRGLLAYNPCYINLGEPLCFDLRKVKEIIQNIPIRLTANCAYNSYLPRENGICGLWVRPEDVSVYDQYVTVLDFIGSLKEEATLLRIYKEDKHWPGNLNLLLRNLDFNVDNRAIPGDLAEKRMNCEQRCMRNGHCHACDTAFKFAETMRKLHESKQRITEN